MKTFKDLEFKDHPIGNGLMARLNFDNGYGVSVVRFKRGDNPFIEASAQNDTYGSYTDNEEEWEVAIIKDGGLCYSTELTSDVLGNQSDTDIDKIMKTLQEMN